MLRKKIKTSLDERKTMKLEELLKKNLNFKTVSSTNYRGGGCISQGQSFDVDEGRKIFVKQNSENIVRHLFFLAEFLDFSRYFFLAGKSDV